MEERQNVGQRESRDSKHCVHLPVSLGCGITTCQPLLPAPQNPGGGLQCASWEFILALSDSFLAQHIICLVKYSVFLKQRCHSLENIALFIENKQGLVSHHAKWQPRCCWVALDSG